MLVVESSGITDVGRKRKGNEDSLYVDDDLRLYVVADGMGGHKAGEVASKIVVDSLRDHMQELDQEELKTGEIDALGKSLSKEARHLISAILQANHNIYHTAQNNESYKGMGATVSAIYLTGDTLIASNVGDSPIYLIRNQAVETLSIPHTLMAEHAAMAPEGAKPLAKQFQHMLTRAMGVEASVKPDISEIPVLNGDKLVICSDGLSDNVTPEEIRDIAVKEEPEQACRALVDLSNSRGGHDNITVIVLEIKQTPDGALVLESDQPEIEIKDQVPTEKLKIAVEYDTEDGSYRSFTRSIRLDGVFIETGESFFEGQEIFMTFSSGEGQSPFMVTGRVVSRNSEGIDVKFDPLSPEDQDAVKSLVEKT